MSLAAILELARTYGWTVTFLVVVALSLLEVSKIKINPLTAFVKWIGRAMNADVLKELADVKDNLQKTKTKLDHHVKIDDERDADLHRYRILRFNTEILRDVRHTKEEFDEILYNIKCYEHYCRNHPDYENNRAVLAIGNIELIYKERMEKRDFLQ